MREPTASAPVVATLDSGQLVRVVDGRRITTSPGVIVVRRTHTLVQRLSGADEDVKLEQPKRWRLFRGDTVFVVDKETDGDSYVNYVWTRRAREDTTAAFWRDPEDEPAPDDEVRMLAPMKQTWWARVRTATGVLGWTAAGDEWSGRSYYDDPASKCAGSAPRR